MKILNISLLKMDENFSTQKNFNKYFTDEQGAIYSKINCILRLCGEWVVYTKMVTNGCVKRYHSVMNGCIWLLEYTVSVPDQIGQGQKSQDQQTAHLNGGCCKCSAKNTMRSISPWLSKFEKYVHDYHNIAVSWNSFPTHNETRWRWPADDSSRRIYPQCFF